MQHSSPAQSANHAEQLSERVKSLKLPRTPSRRSTNWIPWLLTVVFASTSLYLSLRSTSPEGQQSLKHSNQDGSSAEVLNPGNTSSQESQPSGIGNSSGRENSSASKILLESKGWVIPQQQILVSPQVSGRVVQLNFEEGQRVQQGEVLAVLDDTEYKAEYERALADVKVAQERLTEALEGNRPEEISQAEAELEEAKAQLAQAESVLKRRRELFERGILTAQELEDAVSQHDALKARVNRLSAALILMRAGPRIERKRQAEAELQRAQAELVRAKWRLDNTIIYAPIDGTILKKNAELGNLVNPIAFNGSFSLCEMADLTRLEVELNIQERDISRIFKGQFCRIRADALPEMSYEGYVSRRLPIADRAKSAIPVRVRIIIPPDDEGRYLIPEMGATVTFYSNMYGSEPNTLAPQAADHGAPDTKFVKSLSPQDNP